jgi:hypothetical protein
LRLRRYDTKNPEWQICAPGPTQSKGRPIQKGDACVAPTDDIG